MLIEVDFLHAAQVDRRVQQTAAAQALRELQLRWRQVSRRRACACAVCSVTLVYSRHGQDCVCNAQSTLPQRMIFRRKVSIMKYHTERNELLAASVTSSIWPCDMATASLMPNPLREQGKQKYWKKSFFSFCAIWNLRLFWIRISHLFVPARLLFV